MTGGSSAGWSRRWRLSSASARGRLAAGPTLAHAATKRVIRDYLEGGVQLANDRVSRVAGELFATEDLQGAVRSFLSDGPGKATFSGR